MGSEPRGPGEPQRGKKKISRVKGAKERDQEVGKSGLIKKRVVKKSRIGRIGTHLDEPRTEAKRSTEDKKGGTIISNN